jgi:hypothetical protein
MSVEDVVWRRSARCSASNCVEVGFDDVSVWLRTSQSPEGPRLRLSQAEWSVFTDAIKAEEFSGPGAAA